MFYTRASSACIIKQIEVEIMSNAQKRQRGKKPHFLKSRIPQLRLQLAQKIVFYSHKLFGPFFLQEYRWKQPKTAAKEALQLILACLWAQDMI